MPYPNKQTNNTDTHAWIHNIKKTYTCSHTYIHVHTHTHGYRTRAYTQHRYPLLVVCVLTQTYTRTRTHTHNPLDHDHDGLRFFPGSFSFLLLFAGFHHFFGWIVMAGGSKNLHWLMYIPPHASEGSSCAANRHFACYLTPRCTPELFSQPIRGSHCVGVSMVLRWRQEIQVPVKGFICIWCRLA